MEIKVEDGITAFVPVVITITINSPNELKLFREWWSNNSWVGNVNTKTHEFRKFSELKSSVWSKINDLCDKYKISKSWE